MSTYPLSLIEEIAAMHMAAQSVGHSRLRATAEASLAAHEAAWVSKQFEHERALRSSLTDSQRESLIRHHAEHESRNEIVRNFYLSQLDYLPPAPLPLDRQLLASALLEADNEILVYQRVLSVKRRQGEIRGEYGEVDRQKWDREVATFLRKNPKMVQVISNLEQTTQRSAVSFDWVSRLAARVNELTTAAQDLPTIAGLDGHDYELACVETLRKGGWHATLTSRTNDQGVDVLAVRVGRKVAIQCKNYRAPVGNAAVQEVHAGAAYYEAEFSVVVSPSGYTSSARQLAQKLRVLLIDSSELIKLHEML